MDQMIISFKLKMTTNRKPTMILMVRLMMRACLMVSPSHDITSFSWDREHLDLITENDDNQSANYSDSLGH